MPVSQEWNRFLPIDRVFAFLVSIRLIWLSPVGQRPWSLPLMLLFRTSVILDSCSVPQYYTLGNGADDDSIMRPVFFFR